MIPSRLFAAAITAFVLASCTARSPHATTADRAAQPAAAPPPVSKVWKGEIFVHGGGEASFVPRLSSEVIDDGTAYDVVVVGGGLAGLTSALYLTNQGARVLVLEKEDHLGGLASGTEASSGSRYDRGAAYWTDYYKEELKILEQMGLGDYEEKDAIPEPIDSYLWRGVLYEGVWDDETLEQLPASFELFQHELEQASEAGLIPDQPLEEGRNMQLDEMTAAAWIRSMPAQTAARKDADSKAIYARYQRELADGKLPATDPMKDVLDFLDLYCRSALGTNADKVSAMAFGNFYISEIITRYTTPIGTGQAAVNMAAILESRPQLARMEVNAPVGRITPAADYVDVTYVKDGRTHRVRAQYVVFAAQLKFAPKLIDGFTEGAPQKAAMIAQLGYSHYSVHALEVKGHPYRASYDTWVRTANYTEDDFTDVILGRWMDPQIDGYKGMRDFSRNPADDLGIVTIYHPLPQRWVGQGYTEEQARQIAGHALDQLNNVLTPVVSEDGQKIEITRVETNRWPYSVHIAEPGHFKTKAKVLRQPYGRVFFAVNNLGTPAFEEALFRGHCAADNILTRMKPGFQREKWSKCPIEAAPASK